jgi:prepilin-type N-terminal cleavage/methylation domain-containing protein
MTKKNSAAFTLIEMLVVISIIVVLASFAVPAVISGLTKGQLVGTMNNARQMYLAAQQMALDGATNSDANLSWPGDYPATSNVVTLQDYCNKLVQNDYLKPADLPKLLSAAGATCTMTSSTDANGVPTVTLTGKSGLKVYKVKDADSGNTIFAVTANYTYNAALNSATAPYGDKGFIVMHKGGDAISLKKNNATMTSYSGDASKFQAAVGKLTGDVDNTVSGESADKILTNPQ